MVEEADGHCACRVRSRATSAGGEARTAVAAVAAATAERAHHTPPEVKGKAGDEWARQGGLVIEGLLQHTPLITANSRVHRLLTFDTHGLFFNSMGLSAHGAMSMFRVHVRC